MSSAGLEQARTAMIDRGIDARAVGVFEHYYRLLESGAQGLIPEDSIERLHDLPRLDDVSFSDAERSAALAQTVVLKLNGGLGTGMGLDGPKSALVVRDDLTFLDIIARQVLALRERYGVALPLVLMNSFRTREESLDILAKYPDLAVEGLALDFLQSAEPKLRADDLTPVAWPDEPELEWCPPGHGDVYISLVISGLLDQLRERGIRYAFLSNADNLGATCDPDLAAWIVASGAPYVAEVCVRTPSDRKGGHLARRLADGRLILRDSAMVAPGEEHYFGDIERHDTFHANNLWIDLDVFARLLDERDGVLGLPIIVNRKTVDPSDSASTKVIQIETAMGTAIETVDGSQALLVPRTRFRPVKTTNDLLVIRSDVFELDDSANIRSRIDRDEPFVDLDSGVYKLTPDFEQRFPAGPPSLVECTSLRVKGDVTFGPGVRCVGDVSVKVSEPTMLDADTVLGQPVDLVDVTARGAG